MEHRAKFNLKDSIRNWKDNLSNSHSMTTDNVEELESHLLDEMDHLNSKGLNEEEAFIIAMKRMGSTKNLVSEFNKINAFNTFVVRSIPFLKGILFYFSLSCLINILGRFSLLSSEYFSLDLSITNTLFVSVFFLILSVVCYNVYSKIKKGKRVGKIFNNIPLLVLGVITLRVLDVALTPLVIRQITIEEYGSAIQSLNIFSICMIILILITSVVFYFKSKQIQKMKIA